MDNLPVKSDRFSNRDLFSNEENKALLLEHDKCDKYDYLIAVACGVVSGLVDVFLVGAPGDSVLGNWTDKQVDKCVMRFAKLTGWNPKPGQENNVRSAIGFLEKKFKVNYDQRHGGDVNGMFDMSAKNHHMKSLAHSPDIIGLFFSILNQFTSTSTFISNGQLITVSTENWELQGGSFPAKLFCGIANWFGHIMSDVAGSSGSVTRGSGIAMPFYELLGLCNFGKIKVDGCNQTVAQIATRVFESGYDFRHGLTMAIPVILCELSIRLIWAIRQHFQFKKPLKECIPTLKHSNLRIMLLVGNATLCVIDGIDAFARSGGNIITFITRLNIVAWFRLVWLVIKEVCIRLGMPENFDDHLEAYVRINAALQEYFDELKSIDIEKYKKEIETYDHLAALLQNTNDENELNKALLASAKELGFPIPWEGYESFDDFMNDENSRLVFK